MYNWKWNDCTNGTTRCTVDDCTGNSYNGRSSKAPKKPLPFIIEFSTHRLTPHPVSPPSPPFPTKAQGSKAFARRPHASDAALLQASPARVAVFPSEPEVVLTADQAQTALRLSRLLNLNEKTCAGLILEAAGTHDLPEALETSSTLLKAVYLYLDARTSFAIAYQTLLLAALTDVYAPEFKASAADALKHSSNDLVSDLLHAMEAPDEDLEVITRLQHERILEKPMELVCTGEMGERKQTYAPSASLFPCARTRWAKDMLLAPRYFPPLNKLCTFSSFPQAALESVATQGHLEFFSCLIVIVHNSRVVAEAPVSEAAPALGTLRASQCKTLLLLLKRRAKPMEQLDSATAMLAVALLALLKVSDEDKHPRVVDVRTRITVYQYYQHISHLISS